MEIRDRALFFFGILRARLGGVEDQRQNAVEIARPLVHGGDVAIHGKLAGAETNRGLGSSQQKIGEAGYGLLLRFRHSFAVIKGEVVARGLRIRMDIFEKARADIKLLRSPWRLAGFFVQTKIGNGLLGNIELALLLVVVKHSRCRVQVFRIGFQRGMCLVEKLP